MHSPYAYASKRDLLEWVARLLDMDLTSLDDLISGAVWVQILDAHFADVVHMQKVDFFGYTYEQCMVNYKILQQSFNKLGIERDINIQKMLDGNHGVVLELLQWFFRNLGERGPLPGYSAHERRSQSKHGGCDKVPRYGVSEAAFKRWRMKEVAPEFSGGSYVEGGQNPSLRSFDNGRLQGPQRMQASVQMPRQSVGPNHSVASTTPGSYPRRPDSSHGPTSRKSTAPRRNGQRNGNSAKGSQTMADTLAVCDSVSKAVAERSELLASVTKKLETGELNSCISRGCVRSLQNVLVTLVKHASLLLKDVMLRLDVWSDVNAHDFRLQVEDRLHHLTVQQNKMGSVLGRLRQVESGLKAPDTSASADPHSTITALGQAATMLNEVLRRVDQAHAELPPIFEAGVDPTLPQLEQVQLPDVDADTRAEIDKHEPVFLKTSTSYACKIGHFQYRKLRNGDVYKGRYSRSKKSGDGCYMFMNGDMYEGEFKDDHMEGHGVYTFSGQGRYEGSWTAARYCGHGTETFAKGSTYAGEYSAGNRCGYGVCRYYNGDFYEGTWADGVRNGIGMQQCTDGSNYVGQYKEAKREGYGVYTFHNGDCYLGTYKQDLPNGLGVYLFEKGQKYMGEWESGKKHGLCEYIVESGERYVGEWEAGKPKWVQALGLEGDALPELLPDMQSKVRQALEIASKARDAAEVSQQMAAEHWDSKCKTQQMVHRAVDLADDAAVKAQQARSRSMLLAYKLEHVIHSFIGDDGWPQPPADS